MDIQLDWEIVDEHVEWEVEPPPPPPPHRAPTSGPSHWVRTRRFWVIVAALLAIVAASAYAYIQWTYRQRLEQVAGPVRVAAGLEARAIAANDKTTFLALQDPADRAWRGIQDRRFRTLERVGLPEFGWRASGGPGEMGLVSLEPGGARVDVTYRLTVTQPLPNGPGVLTLRVPQFWKSTASGWVHARPSTEFWGPWHSEAGKRFGMAYVQRDASILEPLLPKMDQWLARACGPLPCPPQPIFITFENSPEALGRLSNFSYGFDEQGFVLKLPSPHLLGVPADGPSREEYYRAVGTRVVQALVYEASKQRLNLNYAPAQEIVRWELSRAGLAGPFLTPQLVAARTAAASGTWQRIDEISLQPRGIDQASRAAMLPLALDFIERRAGAGSVSRMIPALASSATLGQAIQSGLGISPMSLETAWEKYLGLPVAELNPPEGELALRCRSDNGKSSVWRLDLTSAKPQQISDPDLDAWLPAWSPDGRRLAYIQGGTLLTLHADTNEQKLVAWLGSSDSFRWTPDGRLYLSGTGNARLAVPDLVASTPLTGVVHTWSPDGTHVAYVAPVSGVDGSNVLNDRIWVADGSGQNAVQVGWGLVPVWMPDGQHLAFIAWQDLTSAARDLWTAETSVQIADVSGSETPSRTLVRLSDLQKLVPPADRVRLNLVNLRVSPDGRWIALYSAQPGRAPITWILDARTGTVELQLSGLMLWFRARSWSPDGRYLALASQSASQANQLTILDTQTRRTVEFPVNPLGKMNAWSVSAPSDRYAWSPDGKWLALAQDPSGVRLVQLETMSSVWLDTPSCWDIDWRPGTPAAPQ